MSTFFKDVESGMSVSWRKLISDINETSTYNPYCRSNNYYEVFRHIAVSLILGAEIILLDSDFTNDELIKLTGFQDFENFTRQIDEKHALSDISKSEFIEKIRAGKKNWKITLFTSGTTGTPKQVTHNYDSITRFVKISARNANKTWGFAYNPTHMAGVQVFLQALLNGNLIVRLFGLNPSEIHRAIKDNYVTHISATPTFYRLLLPCEDSFDSVVRITSGGEKFSDKVVGQLKEVFPNAKITNVYASTEAGTLFASEDDVFVVKAEFHELIRVVNGDLLIHVSLMGESSMNVENWYNTGDLVEIISDQPLTFRFLSRKSEMINVGGYKVNPHEVEEAILSLPGVSDARVFAKSNSVLGNIILCEVVRSDMEVEESTIRKFLQSKIQEFKIPRIIRFVEMLSVTRTGKVKRS